MGLPPRQSRPGPQSRWLWPLRLMLCASALWLVMGNPDGRLGIRPWGGNLRQGHLHDPRGRRLIETAASLHLQPPQQHYLLAQQRCRGPTETESLPVLDQVGTWPAASPVDPQHVTLVTQLSLERLLMLDNQCKVWPHALAAAVYVPLLDGLVASRDSPRLDGISLAQALEVLSTFHARLQSEGACKLQLAVFAERCPDKGVAGLYPFNAMRNKALQMVQTEVVFQLDVDFVVSKEFAEEMSSPAGWAALRQQLSKTPAVIVPCFEPNARQLQTRQGSKQHDKRGHEMLAKQRQLGKAMAFEAVEGGKSWVAAKYTARELQQSAIDKFEAGHNSTQYSRWVEARDYYDVPYTTGYEPYTLMLREHVPWFDERFRGYGHDKMIGYLVMWHWGITFAVHPRAFVVHVPHTVAKTFAVTQRLKKHIELREMFLDASKQLQQQQYFPVTSFAERCPLRPESAAPATHRA